MPPPLPLQNHIHLRAPDSPSSPGASIKPASRTYILYYITGNPGLIEYYRIFLTQLYALLQAQYADQGVEFEIYGRSLPGFEIDSHDDEGREEFGGNGENDRANGGIGGKPSYNVKDQIQMSEDRLKEVVRDARKRGKKNVRVVLMGHSLGTYVCMEILRRVREEAKTSVKGGEGEVGEEKVRVVGAVLLFATVMHLAKSPSGVKAGWLIGLPHFPHLVSLFAKALLFLIPTSLLTYLISVFGHCPAEAARVTAAFVKSPNGVRQSLFLANDEMTEISEDKWDEEIWGTVHPSEHPHPRPTLRFLFGKHDHWVANETRDDLIKARGIGKNGDAEDSWKPKMEVDEEEGWPHAFCLKHSIPVAERARKYVEEIVGKDLEGS